MQDLIVSLNANNLKITTLKSGSFNSVVKEVSKDIVDDSRIVDVETFSTVLSDAINELSVSTKAKFRLNFVMEPEDAFFKFISVNKGGEDLETKIISEIQAKLENVNLNDLYFSYVKIAPFVYQFVGVNKELFEKYLQVASILRLELHSVMPWVLLLPKYVGTNSSSIFVCGVSKNPNVVLSELGGVFFVGSYDENEDPNKLYKLIQELSIYKRPKPIDKVYTFNYPFLTTPEGQEIHKVELPAVGDETSAGFDTNVLTNYMLDLAPDALSSQANFLNLLPVPTVEKKQTSLALIAAPVSALLIAATIFGGMFFISKHNTKPVNGGQVLSDTTAPVANETSQSSPTAPAPDLKRNDLVVRIENGSGASGIAAKTRDMLETLGYKVISIDTANQNRDSTLLKFKTSKLIYKDLLLSDVKSKFPSTEIQDGIETSSEYDVLIVVGTSETF